MRRIKITPHYLKTAEGSALIECGNTRVICAVTVTPGVPKFRENIPGGWLTAEYSMLPRSTSTRTDREAVRGKQTGRTVEISRLIGRSLRAAIDLTALGKFTLTVDCDVLQADGGTRCASISGGMVALYYALAWMRRKKLLVGALPITQFIAAVSVGIVNGSPTVDLCYEQDRTADVDMNFVMTDTGKFIEIQGTAEHAPFSAKDLLALQKLASDGISQLIAAQKRACKCSDQ